MFVSESPFPQYLDIDGSPLEEGYLYFGQPNQNPETDPIPVFWDAAGTQPAAQPIRTYNGYAYRAGTPAPVYVQGDYSITVKARGGRRVYYAASASSFINSAILQQDLADKVTAGKGDSMLGWSSIYTIVAGALTRYVSMEAAVVGLGTTAATIVVRSNTTVGTDLTIPATATLRVENLAQISVNAGQTLTINGECDAPNVRVFTGAGTVIFGSSSRAKSPRIWTGAPSSAVNDTARTFIRTDADATSPVHAYEDNSTVNFAATNPLANAYAGFDCQTQIVGAGTYDHHVSFQARPTYSGSGSLSQRWDGFNWLPTHNGTGTVSTLRGFHAENPLGTGTINFLAGFLCEYLNRGAETHGFFSATPLNTVRVTEGQAATWMLQGNGQSAGFGLSLQSRADSTAHVLQTANYGLYLGANNIYYGFLTPGGLWKFNDTVATVLSANQRVEVAGIGGATLKATGASTVGAVLTWHAATSGDNLFNAFYTEGTATLRGSIDFNRGGTLTRYNTTSDATLKNLIGDVDTAKAVDRLMAVKLHQYSWKDDPEQKSQMGPFAQELQDVMEGAVSVGGWYEDEVDGEKVQRYRPWGVDKTAFVWHLVAGFQEQQRQIQALQQAVAALQRGGASTMGGGGPDPVKPT